MALGSKEIVRKNLEIELVLLIEYYINRAVNRRFFNVHRNKQKNQTARDQYDQNRSLLAKNFALLWPHQDQKKLNSLFYTYIFINYVELCMDDLKLPLAHKNNQIASCDPNI